MIICANPTCNNEVEPQPGRGRPRIYCSRRCNERVRVIKRWAKPALRTCPECETEFEGKGHQKYCCWDHAAAADRRRRAGNQRVRRAKIASDLPVRLCANSTCSKVIPSTRRRTARFCSLECQRTNAEIRAYQAAVNRRTKYGITPEQYESLLAAQDDRCAICRAMKAGGKGGWHVDHCHDTGKIRGLLCHFCNLMLGNAKDDPSTLRAAAEYIEAHR